MRNKAQQSNHNFMFGTLVLGLLVIGIVLLFATLSFRLSTDQRIQAEATDTYHFRLTPALCTHGCAVYLNDKLLYNGIPVSDTILTSIRTADDNALILVDLATDLMQVADIPAKQGSFRIVNTEEGISLREE
jgi:hypothetical protein